ncbi:MAG: quinolinate synthase NadA [Acidobacteria bacterium]|nr:quinolinate synthase NadA [Acidobacteriota bacterium]
MSVTSERLAGAGTFEEFAVEVRDLARRRNAVILAHNYQLPWIQDVADFVGDSLQLSQRAAQAEASTIVFCGVHFMAETAKILSPARTVLLPDLGAGCSLASSITAGQLRAWKAEYPRAVVVAYVNTSAEVKAETDICCTSSNAVEVVRQIPEDREILFLPDMFLGAYVERMTGRSLHVWMGECHVHAGIGPAEIRAALEANPGSEFMVHPECGCSTQCMYLAAAGDAPPLKILSTGGMIREAQASSASSFVVATETGILHQLRKRAPGKRFVPLKESAVCEYMKTITPEKLLRSLREGVFEVTVDPEIAARARRSIERMLEIVP